ncbi:FecR family protein [Myroides albus]|uniref:FecR family protein n=1 Tax=Myroides albus TaxID=2562892 RepID=UPI002159B24E|nr:FecR family protein [Myroides albus]UVD79113.1 FecR family protein [Myroides albus]
MKENRTEILMLKYISRSITPQEKQELLKLLQTNDDNQTIQRIIENDFIADNVIKSFDKDLALKRISYFITKRKRAKKIKKTLLTTVIPFAIIACVLTLVFQPFSLTKQSININQESITIVSSQGKQIQINDTDSETIFDENGQALAKVEDKTMTVDPSTTQMQLNKLIVPKGKTFSLVLSDGTKVFLNAQTSIEFPTSFQNLKTREVSITGEAYFEIQKSDKPFLVESKNAKVRVLGTKFLFSEYEKQNYTSLVLTHGKVEFSSTSQQDKKAEVTPGQKVSLENSTSKIQVENVNTRLYLGWISGELIFRNQSFDQIIKTLERSFNVEIVNQNKELANTVFTASFDNKTIQEIMTYFNEVFAIEYTIKNNKIIIK